MLYHLNVFVHVLSAMVWVGGMFFFALVGAPVLRSLDAELRARLFRQLGERFRVVGWFAVAVLLITGLLNLHFRGLLSSQLFSAAFWDTRYGHILAWKLGSISLMLIIQAFHDFHLGPRAGMVAPGSEQSLQLRGQAALLARVSALIALVIVAAAVLLARPGVIA